MDLFRVHVEMSRNAFFDGSSNCNKLLPADIGNLLDSCTSIHMKTGRVSFSEKMCFRGRLENGHSVGNQ